MATDLGAGRRVASGSATLAPPANEELTRRSMERSPSMTMRAEKEDLKEAAEESYNVIMDLNIDGKVRWVSPSWDAVIGTSRDSIQGQPIADLLVDDKEAFQRAVETMKTDDSRSYKLRFSVTMGSMSKLSKDSNAAHLASPSSEVEAFQMDEIPEQQTTLTLEGQGILIYDRSTGEPSHTMWVVRPFVEPTEITIDLAPVLVESLGVGAGMLARYLTSLAEQGAVDPENHPPPMPVLCRICERQIQPWWFEKHSELCMLEHKAESDVQLCQENLGMHRQAIVKVLDAMERRSARSVPGESAQPLTPIEYRGMQIGPSSPSPSGIASPGTPPSRSHSASGNRSRFFPTRRPLVRKVELLLDLCDTALEISTPAIKEGSGMGELGTFRTQSPESEARINQVMQWQSPTTNTMDEEKGLALLCQDTEAAAKAKVEAVFRHRNTIEYSERIRLEFSMLVQDCIDEALKKATEPSNDDLDYSGGSEDEESIFDSSFSGLQRSNSNLAEPDRSLRRHSSPAGSGTTSPMECSTPKSQQSLHRVTSRRARYHRASMQFENEGADSDTSAKSSSAAVIGHGNTESPISDHELAARLSRDNRRSVLQPNSSHSPKRQPSPSRMAPSSSPLRISKPRASMYENMPTPITSPLLSTGDFSPALEHNFHHRRQSSATLSDQVNKSGGAPSSPHLSGVNPSQQNRAMPPSIKDFEIIKPISKGAFGSVYLSKKKSTGDYFAIKVLKKADMIAKNQVTNVRAERAIMMVQGESDFVAKLFWTFASKDYLYLVMEYLNGGDCAALIKVLGGLPEAWAKKYLAEVVLGLEHLHGRGIIHRDLKPDNLLIDQKGHLKLTDFGLSRMGLIGRQKRAQTQSSESTPDLLKQGPFQRSKSMASSRSTSFDYPGATSPSITPGTGQDETSDWWSLGCILFEFLYGYPPFHADTPEQVFENILARKIDWPDLDDDEDEASPDAKDIMNQLMCSDQTQRLGANGAEEVKNHPFFAGINWDTLLEEEPQFVPTPQNPEDTEYFDSRGATLQSFGDEFDDQSTPSTTPGADLPERPHDAVSRVRKEIGSSKRGLIPLSIPPHVREGRNRRLSEPAAQDDFGTFAFKNLPVLEKANKDVIQKLKTEALKSTPALTTSNPASPMDTSPIASGKPLGRALSNSSKNGGKRPVSPSSHFHHSNSSPARVSQPSSPLLVSFSAAGSDKRKMSTASISSNLSQQSNPSSLQPGSFTSSAIPSSVSSSPTKTFQDSKQPVPMPANPRVRSLTVGSTDSETASVVENFRHQQKRRSQVFDMSPSSSDNEDVRSSALLRVQRRRQSARRMSNISFDCPIFRPLDVLVCEDHPVSRMVMERLLEKLKCRTIMVENGAEAMRYAMGEVKFDIILMEFKLPQINGEDVARMIRTSKNPNSSTPIVAVTGYLKDLSDPQHFDELMEKPATPSKLIDVLERLCFWKAPPAERTTFGDRKESVSARQPPIISDKIGQMSPTVERFMAGARTGVTPSQYSTADDDAISISSSNWDIGSIGSGLTLEPGILGNTLPPPQPVSIAHQETAPTRLQSHAMERIPSPLSTQISAGMMESLSPPPLPASLDLAPLPPSITSTPAFGSHTVESPKTPRSRSNSPPVLQRFRTHPPVVKTPEDADKKKEEKLRFSMLFSPSKDKNLSDQDDERFPPQALDFKTKNKRSSMEKKKEKLGKQRKEGLLGEEADADDEDSLSGGKKPNKSRSIGELIRGVKRSPPELKRTKSSEGRRV
ncbi:hypothetical protein FN846DRAFT_776830 [Sphaerosporella brunnea]|uniref:non-specific serine/threonine protein kinase n=1 Tax=Sphaerosporella brunnea TaxID=1250544 RepID=A0A5J5EZU2_9PEZI|nr:hypothetical protein FN846DRAFT_776830 [Sphaerosporella brunnea]